ncbi:MAG: imidazole glycerol phosphate synthase subunit HisH [Patescibacteria group bacterium]|jgi:glutamine amidotransferase
MGTKILIIDYKVGNHQSIVNALNFLGYDFIVSSRKSDIIKAQSYILPGVGAFGEAMKNFNKLDILDCLQEQVLIKKKPILGICLGMQILAKDSEESGFCQGLGWIDGHVVALNKAKDLRIPHVGWDNIKLIKKDPLFLRTDNKELNYYFDHSYHFVCADKFISARCYYGEDFAVAVQKNNIFGVQFHPEKSQRNGLKLLRCFLDISLKYHSV